MIYAVLFEDNDGKADVRNKHMSDHITFLEQNTTSVRAAGPLKDSETGAPAGGLWLVDAENPAVVRRLVETDPFWPTGLRRSVRVLQWTHVFADGERKV